MDSGFAVIASELTAKCNALILMRAGLSSSQDPDILVTSILSSGVSLNARTAKVLARLQIRKSRENEDCAHAWRNWSPPIKKEKDSPLG
jgi:spore maturation protein SpmA